MIVNAAGSLFYQGCLWAITVLVVVLSGGYENSGILAFAMTVGNMFNPLATYSMRTYQVSDTEHRYHTRNYVALRLITILGALAFCIPYALAFETYRSAILVIIVYLLFKSDEAFSDVLFGIYQRGERLDYSSVSQAVRGALCIALFAAGLVCLHSLLAAVAGMLVAGLLVTVIYDLPHSRRFADLKPRIRKEQVFSMLRECLPVVLSTLFASAVVSVARQHFGDVYGADELGKYASVATPAVLVQALAQFLYTPVLVPLSRRWSSGDGFLAYLLRSLAVTSIVVIGIVVFVAVIGPWLLPLVYGPSISGSLYLLPAVLVCTLLLAVSRFLSDTLVVCREMRAVLVSNLIAMVTSLALMYPVEGAMGAQGVNVVVGVATLASILVSAIALLRVIRRHEAASTGGETGEGADEAV